MKSLRRFTVVLFVLSFASLALAAGDPTGTWKFKAEAAGRSVESTLALQWADNRLTGSITNRKGKVDIKDAQFSDNQVTFTVERKIGRRLRKKTFTLHYAGKLEGDTITGTIQTTNRDKEPVSLPWEAQRVK